MIRHLALFLIDSGSNIRETHDEEVRELAADIEKNGLLQPLVVRRTGSRYELVAGHRRFEALKMIGEDFADCNVIEDDLTQKDVDLLQIAENIQRREMSAWDLVQIFDRWKKQYKLTNAAIGKLVNKSTSWVANHYEAVSFLKKEYGDYIPEEMKKLSTGKLKIVKKNNRTIFFDRDGVTCRKSGKTYMLKFSDQKIEKKFMEFLNGI